MILALVACSPPPEDPGGTFFGSGTTVQIVAGTGVVEDTFGFPAPSSAGFSVWVLPGGGAAAEGFAQIFLGLVEQDLVSAVASDPDGHEVRLVVGDPPYECPACFNFGGSLAGWPAGWTLTLGRDDTGEVWIDRVYLPAVRPYTWDITPAHAFGLRDVSFSWYPTGEAHAYVGLQGTPWNGDSVPWAVTSDDDGFETVLADQWMTATSWDLAITKFVDLPPPAPGVVARTSLRMSTSRVVE